MRLSIIASNTSAITEISVGVAFLRNPFDIDGLAKGIDQINHDTLIRQSFSEKGLWRAKLFNWINAAKETLNILEWVMKSS